MVLFNLRWMASETKLFGRPATYGIFFGARRSGNYITLEAAGKAYGFGTARMDSHEIRGVRVSSTLIREALARGDIGEVELLLGRPYVAAQQAKPNEARVWSRPPYFRTSGLRQWRIQNQCST
jgi:hypothetical protein